MLPLCDCQSIVDVALGKHQMMPMNVASRMERRLRFLRFAAVIMPLWNFS